MSRVVRTPMMMTMLAAVIITATVSSITLTTAAMEEEGGVSSLCTVMFFTSHSFHLEEQSPHALEESVTALCREEGCTSMLRRLLHTQHQACLLHGTEGEVGEEEEEGRGRMGAEEFVRTRAVEGLCITTVKMTKAIRFFSPSKEEAEEQEDEYERRLEYLLEQFCSRHLIPVSQVPAMKEYALRQCSLSTSLPVVKRRQLLEQTSPPPGHQQSHDDFSLCANQHGHRTVKEINSAATLSAVREQLLNPPPLSPSASNGLLLLPRYKLLLCIPPKSGLVSILFLLLAILGNDPNDICGCGGEGGKWRKFGCLGMHLLRHYSLPMFRGMLYLNDEIRFSSALSSQRRQQSEEWLRSAFTDETWTTVMVGRDPWRRAISAFHEDNGYHKWIDVEMDVMQTGKGGDGAASGTCSQREMRRRAMLRYLRRPFYNHGMPACSFCNLPQGLKFDHYFDIDSGLPALAKILRRTHPPVPSAVFTTGWDNCTVGNNPSILNARLKSSHHWKESQEEVDAIYCSPEIVQAVIRHFQEDYDFLVPLMNFSLLPKCLVHKEMVEWMADKD